VGPFYSLQHVQFGDAYFRGQRLGIDMSVAVGQAGPIQIELIVQHDDSPSIYTEFLKRHGEGLQHVGVLTPSLDAELKQLKALGVTPVQWGATAAGMRFAYVDTDFHPGAMVEYIETGEAIEAFFGRVRRAAVDWDGSRPLRPLS
jgi:methylmalonyl-CoA/ethylmalonyl-CoA epimerase